MEHVIAFCVGTGLGLLTAALLIYIIGKIFPE